MPVWLMAAAMALGATSMGVAFAVLLCNIQRKKDARENSVVFTTDKVHPEDLTNSGQ